MFEKEFINFIAENMCETDFLSERFIKYFKEYLYRYSIFTNKEIETIEINDKVKSYVGGYEDKNIVLYKNSIQKSFPSFVSMYHINEVNQFSKNTVTLMFLIHEIAHAYQDSDLCTGDLSKMFTFGYKVLAGLNLEKVDTLLNHLTKLSEKVSKEIAMYLKGVEGINIYNKYYDIFPNERHADGVSYSFLLDIYDKLGSDSFISYEDFLHTIYTYVTRNYYVNGSLIISPVGEFYKKIGKYDVFKNYDFNSLSDKDKVLFGLCENKSSLTEVVNTNILKRKI